MAITLPFISAAPPVQPSARPVERSSEPQNPAAGSFGEALSRASQSAEDMTAKPVEKAATKAAVRRTDNAGNAQEEPAEPTLLAGLVMMPLDIKSPAAGPGSSAAALKPEARALVAADPLAKALLGASLPPEDTALLPDAGISVALKADPTLLQTLAAQGARERGLPLTNTKNGTAVPVAAADSAPTLAPEKALDAASDATAALLEPELAAAKIPEDKAAPARKAVPTAASDVPTRLDAVMASMAASGSTGTDPGEQAGSEPTTAMTGSAIMGSTPQGPSNIGSTVLATAVAPPALPQDVGSSEWGKALGKHLLVMGQSGQETAVLQLNPPGLGPLKITLSMSEQQIQVAFISTHALVRAAVEAALPQLRVAMADGGLSLGEASIGSESRQPADTGTGQEQRPGQRNYPGSSAGEFASTAGRADTEQSRPSNRAGVDIYA